MSRFGGAGRQQRRLHALREPHLLLEALFVRADLFVQPRVLDRDGRLARQQRQDLDVALAERVELRTLEIDHADAAVLQQQRDGELGPHVRHELDVARILRDVRHEHRLAVQRRVADEPFAEPHVAAPATFSPYCTASFISSSPRSSFSSRMPKVR